ncbi:MAG: hypothetical protein O2887_15505 [Bacteroidetes bacterium]|nr:hypothetical protein [Bacteroidota bacterium]MDA1121870.1 hypothetical protein [Bacteroidota bacterium]
MKRVFVVFFVLLFSLNMSVLAQPGWEWGAQEEKAKEKNALYSDAMKLGDYKNAARHLSWLLINVPDLNNSLYINGAKIYEGLADAEKDKTKQLVYVDSAMIMYDLRVKNFGEEGEVLNRKAFKAYKYYKDSREKYADVFTLFQKAFEINKNEIFDNNIVAYMDVVRRYKLTGGDVSDERVIDIYSELNEIIDYKVTSGTNLDRLEVYRDQIDKLLTATVTVDCDFVEKNLIPKVDADPSDLKMAKKVFQLLLTGKCTNSASFVRTAQIVNEAEPNYGMSIVIAKKLSAEEDYAEAEVYYKKAQGLTDDNTKKGEIQLDLAKIYNVRKNKEQARAYALRSVQFDPSAGAEAYTMIGHLYMGSYDDCRAGISKVEDRGVFLAAYEMYRKAGNSEGMKNAKEQFPSIDEIFELGLSEGETFKVECWVNEVVNIQRRPNN